MISAEEILEDLTDVKLKAKLVNDFGIATKQVIHNYTTNLLRHSNNVSDPKTEAGKEVNAASTHG